MNDTIYWMNLFMIIGAILSFGVLIIVGIDTVLTVFKKIKNRRNKYVI